VFDHPGVEPDSGHDREPFVAHRAEVDTAVDAVEGAIQPIGKVGRQSEIAGKEIAGTGANHPYWDAGAREDARAAPYGSVASNHDDEIGT
jgi:hypothetical protein